MTESTRVLVGLGLGLAGGLAIAASGNPTLVAAADAVAPAGQLWVNAIRMTVIPLLVSLVVTGVASASSVGAIGRIGGRTIAVFIAMLTGAALLAIPLGIAAFSWLSRIVTDRPALPPGAVEAAQACGQRRARAWVLGVAHLAHSDEPDRRRGSAPCCR
jgi:hypothetical protein